MSSRLSRIELFYEIARLYGRRSSCPRADVGVIAIRDGRITAAGYVGAPQGMPHCLDVGCLIEGGGCVRSVHAEANMVAWAAREGISLKGTNVFCTHLPCLACAKLLANAGIASLHYENSYRDNRGGALLQDMGITISRLIMRPFHESRS